ncbi:MAG: dihydrodipicolinate synthase family protein [Bryobacterales bacterium]|nr:dihydrodipicolinate synthase family protein [Bryobacterales bacterium]
MFRLKEDGNMIGLKDSSNDRDCTRLLATRLRAQTAFSYLHGNELLMLEAASCGAHGAMASLANLAPRLLADAFDAGRETDATQQEIAALIGAFGLFEERPQDSTTLRLMALKAVPHALGIMDTHMAQLPLH